MAAASGHRRAGSGGSAAGGSTGLSGSGRAQHTLRRLDERGGGETVEDHQGRGDEC